MPDLSPRQEAIVGFIAWHIDEFRYPPTTREIGEGVGLSSSSSVHAQLYNLRRLKVIEWTNRSPRSIRLLTSEAR